MSVHWPDIAILGVLFIATLRGYKRGFITQLGGLLALYAAFWAAFNYGGSLDGAVSAVTHLAPGSAHAVGLALWAFGAYGLVVLAAALLSRVAKLPLIGQANGGAGGLVGLLQGGLLVWAILYFVLFLPLPDDVRSDLRDSGLAAFFRAPNKGLNERVQATLPWFAQPFVKPYFEKHES